MQIFFISIFVKIIRDGLGITEILFFEVFASVWATYNLNCKRGAYISQAFALGKEGHMPLPDRRLLCSTVTSVRFYLYQMIYFGIDIGYILTNYVN